MAYEEFGNPDIVKNLIEQELGSVIGEFEITTLPAGGAPEEIREDWIGVRLPFRRWALEERPPVFYDHISGSFVERLEQVAIFGLDAVVALRNASRNNAADWWVESGHALGTFVFQGKEGTLTIFPNSTV